MLITTHRLQDLQSNQKISHWLASLDYGAMLDFNNSAIPFIERFDWQGRNMEPGFRRVRVMARQTYVLCQAALLGNETAASLAPAAATAFIRHAMAPDGQFLCRLSPDGQALDATPDLYDIAFGLFALSWWYRLSGDSQCLVIAERSIARLNAVMRSPSGKGFVSRLGEPTGHTQNPHMHLFEAAIMLADFSGRDTFMELADSLFALASERLFDPTTSTLAEVFDDDWKAIGTTSDGNAIRIEPGHQYEWVWLLNRYAALRSGTSALEMADQLFAFAQSHGHDAATGLIVDAVRPDGSLMFPGLRLWPNTEYLKAQVAMCERRGSVPDAAIDQNVERIFDRYLTPPASGPASDLRQGWWIDYLDADGITPKCDHVPASSLYHIVFAFSEFLRFTGAHDAKQSANQASPLTHGKIVGS
ncbi:mannose/cellobiose epimerase-like protein (N-acyl-D-glucosamine 2-epimerase family) [Novosphingobium sp. SG751A]|uniref:AGE family epimerase/isomerase n=1 Tax=Novosphingobium sp. SG751A TaxID=2587000 RepID=UPI00155771EF|nr:AGE family epimerase/isomerase [Novosphingobium sp. SG751A]NOW48382.1 mannose/cellobiose epimerase-like protein (N-acyl-D-glucosamine 2-epimerase family) [Novosphingobium sp. SG751A]